MFYELNLQIGNVKLNELFIDYNNRIVEIYTYIVNNVVFQ